MTVTDFATLILSVFFLVRGASRGFINSLTVLFSIIVATVISIIYYQYTHDMIASMALGLIGPVLLSLLLKFLFKIWVKAAHADIKQPGFLSRLGGAVLTFTWWWAFIIFTLILLTVLPPLTETLTTIRHDVTTSASYIYIAKPVEDVLFSASKHNAPAVTGETPDSEAKSLAQDPRFQKILQDPEIQKEIDMHDIVKLMNNPKMMELVQEIMNDPAAIKKVITSP